MSSLAKDNDGYTFLLIVIDCSSKYAWAELLLNKSGDEILKALTRLLSRSTLSETPANQQRDRVYKSKSSTFLRERKIEFFTKNSEMKAAIVECFNRTLKTKMWMYFSP